MTLTAGPDLDGVKTNQQATLIKDHFARKLLPWHTADRHTHRSDRSAGH